MTDTSARRGGNYRRFLARKHTKYLFTTNLIGRLPNGMGALAVALYLRDGGLGYRAVGALMGLYAVAIAIGEPMLARVIDRRRPRPVLVTSAAVSGLGLAVLLFVDPRNTTAVAVVLIVAGLSSPPLEPCLRSLWSIVLPEQEARETAYALDAALQEVVFVAGPLVVTGLLASGRWWPALAVTAAATALGTFAFAAAPTVGMWRGEHRAADWLGPLRSATLRRLLLACGCVGLALGVLNIAAIAYAESVGHHAMSGILLGANAFGALVGGVCYGARSWPGSAPSRIVALFGLLSVSYLPLLIVGPPSVMTVLMFLAGLPLAPVLSCGFSIIGEEAPAGTVTEAFAWMVAVIGIGIAIGAALGGAAVPAGLFAVFAIPVLATVSAVGVAWWDRSLERR